MEGGDRCRSASSSCADLRIPGERWSWSQSFRKVAGGTLLANGSDCVSVPCSK